MLQVNSLWWMLQWYQILMRILNQFLNFRKSWTTMLDRFSWLLSLDSTHLHSESRNARVEVVPHSLIKFSKVLKRLRKGLMTRRQFDYMVILKIHCYRLVATIVCKGAYYPQHIVFILRIFTSSYQSCWFLEKQFYL